MATSLRYPAYGGEGPLCIRVGLSLGVIATILMVLRVYVRLRINTLGSAALLWALSAWLLTAVTQTLAILAAFHGLGNHIDVVLEKGEGHNFLKFAWLTMLFFIIAIAVGKCAVAAFILEINGHAYPRFRYLLIAVGAVNVLSSIPIVVRTQLSCHPHEALWDPSRQSQCDSNTMANLSYVIGAIAACSDFVLAIAPVFLVWSLPINKAMKLGLCFLLGLGILAAAAAVVRTWACRFLKSQDSSYHLATLFLWGEVEEWVILITMSVPPVWPLIKSFVVATSTCLTSRHTNDKFTSEHPAAEGRKSWEEVELDLRGERRLRMNNKSGDGYQELGDHGLT